MEIGYILANKLKIEKNSIDDEYLNDSTTLEDAIDVLEMDWPIIEDGVGDDEEAGKIEDNVATIEGNKKTPLLDQNEITEKHVDSKEEEEEDK